MAFNALFPGITNQVFTFNAPGFFEGSSGNQAFFATLGGAIPTEANSGNVTNVIADEAGIGDAPWTAIAGLGSRPGIDLNIPIENQWLSDEPQPESAKNHSIRPLTDSLAVFDLLTELAPTLSVIDYKLILNQAAAGTAASYERLIDGLNGLFGWYGALPVGNSNRDALYNGLYDLQADVGFTAVAGRLQIIPAGTNPVALAGSALDGIDAMAYRYAIRELNPFVVLGDNGIYDLHNVDGSLDLYDGGLGVGMTAEYIKARAELLNWKSQSFTNNGETLRSKDLLNATYIDKTQKDISGSDLTFTVVGRQRSTADTKIVFGSEQSETIAGGDVFIGDRLFGGNGNDTLIGNG
ncbi:MAG TPA: hypothetical protein VFK03_00430, partial [Candidatus Saccharimonadales bacterium]|nr:hypothetical protein [Candidatus Saccharimonadales bacterium]